MDVPLHSIAHEAMATSFEVLVAHDSELYARQAAQAYFNEIDRIESLLSTFIESSDISRLNAAVSGTPIAVHPDTFKCLTIGAWVSDATHGAFDMTVGVLMDAWRTGDGVSAKPSDRALADALSKTTVAHIGMLEGTRTIQLRMSGVKLDLGGIGKGFALDKGAAVLAEWGIGHALLSAGSSTVLALGSHPIHDQWPVGVGDSEQHALQAGTSISASGNAERGAHIFDPRTGEPAKGTLRAWAIAPTASLADALSTAFMVMTETEVKAFCQAHPKHHAVLLLPTKEPETLPRRVRF